MDIRDSWGSIGDSWWKAWNDWNDIEDLRLVYEHLNMSATILYGYFMGNIIYIMVIQPSAWINFNLKYRQTYYGKCWTNQCLKHTLSWLMISTHIRVPAKIIPWVQTWALRRFVPKQAATCSNMQQPWPATTAAVLLWRGVVAVKFLSQQAAATETCHKWVGTNQVTPKWWDLSTGLPWGLNKGSFPWSPTFGMKSAMGIKSSER